MGTTYHYAGVQTTFSGDDVTNPVKEWIKIKGKMTKALVLKAFGYRAGTATITYSWGGRETPHCERVVKTEKAIKKQEMDRVLASLKAAKDKHADCQTKEKAEKEKATKKEIADKEKEAKQEKKEK